MLGFLDVTIVREAKLDPSTSYIFGIAPHGILSMVRALFCGTVMPRLFPGVYGRWVAATPQFLVPFGCRETMLAFQAIDASKPGRATQYCLAKCVRSTASCRLVVGSKY